MTVWTGGITVGASLWSVDPYFQVIAQEKLHKKVKWSIFIGEDIEVFRSGWVRGEGAIGGG